MGHLRLMDGPGIGLSEVDGPAIGSSFQSGSCFSRGSNVRPNSATRDLQQWVSAAQKGIEPGRRIYFCLHPSLAMACDNGVWRYSYLILWSYLLSTENKQIWNVVPCCSETYIYCHECSSFRGD